MMRDHISIGILLESVRAQQPQPLSWRGRGRRRVSAGAAGPTESHGFLCLSLEASFQRLLPRQLLCQQSICHLRYGAAFEKGLPTLQGNFDEEFRGAHTSISPPPASLWFLPAPPASPEPLRGAQVGPGAGAAGSRGSVPSRVCTWQGGQLEEQEGTDATGAQICSCRKNARS